ncbi:hypothetical protein [Alienimonas sp. DA493]|uniref:hypothetical protein n=1 Tax=Alienimonas sp. DA493 TaxID=3373605 RepID=UPI0037549B46
MTNPFTDAAPADLCLHAANFCYLASYLTRDMLWLRLLTCVGMSLQIVFFTCGSVPMFGPTAWMATFVGINVIQILRLLRYRERIQLNAEEAALSEEAFEHLSREELADLLTRSVRIGTRQTAEINPHELTEGELTEDEIVLRDMAFGGLTRSELLNLVTRRFHGTTAHLTPSRVRLWTERRKRRWSQWTAQRAAKKAGRDAAPGGFPAPAADGGATPPPPG